jgi:hypothetical protein
MAKTVADMLVERLIDWGVDTTSAIPVMASTACLRLCARIRKSSSLFRCVTKNRRRLPLGMHLRGNGRQMGGLYLTIFNWLEGPPAFAPALFTGFAAVGLIAIYFL